MAEDIMQAIKPSPCNSCTTVKDTRLCQNVNCKRWMAWYIEQWDYLTELIKQKINEMDGESSEQA